MPNKYYKCVEPGWITIKDFIDKYHSNLTDVRKSYKNDHYQRVVKELPDQIKCKPARTWFVKEFEFCLRVRVEFKESKDNELL